LINFGDPDGLKKKVMIEIPILNNIINAKMINSKNENFATKLFDSKKLEVVLVVENDILLLILYILNK